jgi:hypothetical protein
MTANRHDALLLVAPLAAFFLCCLTAVSGKRLSRGGGLSIAVLLLAVLMTAQIFNPAQGGLVVGLGGALFYLVPLLWFWIGSHEDYNKLMGQSVRDGN